jgi:hypothetical protein
MFPALKVGESARVAREPSVRILGDDLAMWAEINEKTLEWVIFLTVEGESGRGPAAVQDALAWIGRQGVPGPPE